MKGLIKHLVPNLGTMVILGLFLLLQSTGVLSAPSRPAVADIPTRIGYQGQLTDIAGMPVPDGTYSMVFSIYDDSGGGAALWSEPQDVDVTDGQFDVLLGSVMAIGGTVFDGSERWLGVQVDGDPEMTPRQPLASVPFALRADVADASITTSKLADGAVTSAKMDAVDAYSYVEVEENTTSTEWTPLPTPDSVTISLERPQWVNIQYGATCAANEGFPAYMGLSIDGQPVQGDTLIEMWNGNAWWISGIEHIQLSAGQHTITAKYKTLAGGNAHYWRRKLLVFSISQ